MLLDGQVNDATCCYAGLWIAPVVTALVLGKQHMIITNKGPKSQFFACPHVLAVWKVMGQKLQMVNMEITPSKINYNTLQQQHNQ